MTSMIKNSKNTILTIDGKVLFFGIEDYMDKIANGDCCFICGAEPNSKEFNNEHIIPDWILRKYGLYSKFITLPNGTKFKYNQYTVPCCKDCNSELGRVYEEPISNLLSKSYPEIVQSLQEKPDLVHFIFRWLSLIFLKTHLKDKSLLLNRDKRKNTEYISKDYYWEDMHHIHCISRSFFSGAKIDKEVYGTILILPTFREAGEGDFDYVDSHAGKGVLLQLGDFSIIAVLNDSCAGYTAFLDNIKKIKGALNSFQLREILAHLNYINLSLKERPIFKSSISPFGEYRIIVETPKKLELIPNEENIITPGKILRYYVDNMIGDVEGREKILDEIEQGKRGYLFDENGDFMTNKETTTANN